MPGFWHFSPLIFPSRGVKGELPPQKHSLAPAPSCPFSPKKYSSSPRGKGSSLDLYTESNTNPTLCCVSAHTQKLRTPRCFIPFCFNPSDTTPLPSQLPFHQKKGANFVEKSRPGPAMCCNLQLEAASLAKLCEDTGAAPELCTQFLPLVPPIPGNTAGGSFGDPRQQAAFAYLRKHQT